MYLRLVVRSVGNGGRGTSLKHHGICQAGLALGKTFCARWQNRVPAPFGWQIGKPGHAEEAGKDRCRKLQETLDVLEPIQLRVCQIIWPQHEGVDIRGGVLLRECRSIGVYATLPGETESD
jgi:hypothetical protein